MKKIILTLVVLLFYSNLLAQITEQKLFASDGVNENRFGYSVEVTDSFAFVGAPGDNENGASSGSVYIYKKMQTNWVEVQKITASYGQPGDGFGTAISSDNDYLVVGAPGAPGGLIYVYKREQDLWSEIQIFYSPSISGRSLSIDVPYIIVGSAGYASIFKLEDSQWIFKQQIVSSDHHASDGFGSSVSIYENTALVGAYSHSNENGSSAGSAYLFKRDSETWIETQRILAGDTLARFFGYSVDLQGNKAIIGAIWDDTFVTLNGSAYIYNVNNDSLDIDQKVFASDWNLDDRFGSAVSILGDVAVVGAFGVDLNTYDVGAAYIFKKENGSWFEVQKLTPLDIITDLQFGTSVALCQHSILVGAPATYAQDTTGLAHIYDGIIVSVDQEDLSTVSSYKLEQNYPNPFNPSTKIRFVIPNAVRNLKDFSSQSPRNDNSLVTLKVYDILGNEIATLVNKELSPGEYEVTFDVGTIRDLSLTSGIYFYTLRTGDPSTSSGQGFIQSKKMVLIK